MDLFENRSAEYREKLERLRAVMQANGADSLLIRQSHNFSWLLCGAENFVFFAASEGAAPVLVTPEKVFLVSNNIESVRLVAEELRDLDVEDCHHLWYLSGDENEAHIRKYAKGTLKTDIELEDAIKAVRDPLCKDEIARYRWLSRQAEEAVRVTCQSAKPGMTEYEIAGRLAQEALSRKILPALFLVASDERAYHFRHPIPRDKTVKNHFMLVLGARRFGLVASVTRMVSFGEISEELHRRHSAVCSVDAAMILASRPGAKLGDVLQKGIAAYEERGYGDEWKLHHQGGIAGYLGRTYKATPSGGETIMAKQAVAWNPTIAGTKSEDTVLILDDGYEILTQAKEWPLVQVSVDGETIDRCGIYIP